MERIVNNYDELNKLRQLKFNDPYTIRNFKVNTKDIFVRLVENYIDNFAFSIMFKNDKFSIIKENGVIYLRNCSKRSFEFPHCPPPVSNDYDVKANNIDEVTEYLN